MIQDTSADLSDPIIGGLFIQIVGGIVGGILLLVVLFVNGNAGL